MKEQILDVLIRWFRTQHEQSKHPSAYAQLEDPKAALLDGTFNLDELATELANTITSKFETAASH